MGLAPSRNGVGPIKFSSSKSSLVQTSQVSLSDNQYTIFYSTDVTYCLRITKSKTIVLVVLVHVYSILYVKLNDPMGHVHLLIREGQAAGGIKLKIHR